MPRLTVYLSDEHLARLRRLGFDNTSRAFQSFVESLDEEASRARLYAYAESLMPMTAWLGRVRLRLAETLQEGGPPATGGPVATALAVLIHQEFSQRCPESAGVLAEEYRRFGLEDFARAQMQQLHSDGRLDHADRFWETHPAEPATGGRSEDLGPTAGGESVPVDLPLILGLLQDALLEGIARSRTRHRSGRARERRRRRTI